MAFRDPHDVDTIARLEAGDGHRCADFDVADAVAKLSHEAGRLDALLLEVSRKRARNAISLHRLETQSNGIIAVALFRSALHDRAGTGGDHRNGHGAPVGGEDAGHPDFTAQDVLHASL